MHCSSESLILKFRIGKFAVTGDLQQFYNAFKLVPTQLNLKGFLFKADLDPAAPVESSRHLFMVSTFPLHTSKRRGKLAEGTKFFSGELKSMHAG
jgi:hypothetical protein